MEVEIKEYPFVLSCSTCGTHFVYMRHKPEVGELMLAEDMTYATGEKPVAGERPKNCFHCGNIVPFSVSRMEERV